MVQALTLRAAAGHAAAAGYWKRVEGFCTANSRAFAAHGCGESANTLPDGPHLPPTAHEPMGVCAHNSINVQGCSSADIHRAKLTHICALAREGPGRNSRARHWARLRHTSDDAGSGRATTPGDHAANLGATMLDPCYTRLRRPTSRRRTRHAVHPESTLLLSVQNALALISSLYYTHAPQLLTRHRQRARSHTRKSLLVAPSPHVPHTHEHSSDVPNLESPNPRSI